MRVPLWFAASFAFPPHSSLVLLSLFLFLWLTWWSMKKDWRERCLSLIDWIWILMNLIIKTVVFKYHKPWICSEPNPNLADQSASITNHMEEITNFVMRTVWICQNLMIHADAHCSLGPCHFVSNDTVRSIIVLRDNGIDRYSNWQYTLRFVWQFRIFRIAKDLKKSQCLVVYDTERGCVVFTLTDSKLVALR